MNTISPKKYYKSTRIRVTGRKFGSRNSRNLFRLIKSGRAYPIAIRSWSNTVVEGTLPDVANGRYLLQLQVYALGHHTASPSQTIEIISKAFIKNPSILGRPAPRVRLGKQLRNRRFCPDPAVVRIVPGWPTRNANGTYNFRLFAVIRNVGRVTYRSLPSQQQITLKQGNRVLKVSRWSRAIVPPGARGEVASESFNVRNWNPNPGEFAANFSAHITYAPDIGNDGNPNNDDCRKSNNRKVLTVGALRRMLSTVR